MTLAELIRGNPQRSAGPDVVFGHSPGAAAFGRTAPIVAGRPAEVAPEAAFFRGLAAYLRRTGHAADPLVGEGGVPAAGGLVEGAGSRRGLPGSVVRVGGTVFHVYFHPDGRREIVKVMGPGIHGGGVPAPPPVQ